MISLARGSGKWMQLWRCDLMLYYDILNWIIQTYILVYRKIFNNLTHIPFSLTDPDKYGASSGNSSIRTVTVDIVVSPSTLSETSTLNVHVPSGTLKSIYKICLSWYSWNTAEVGVKHQSINQCINQCLNEVPIFVYFTSWL
jgi:hypothetical protein